MRRSLLRWRLTGLLSRLLAAWLRCLLSAWLAGLLARWRLSRRILFARLRSGILRLRELAEFVFQFRVRRVHRRLRLRGLLRLRERLLRVGHLLLRGLLHRAAELLELLTRHCV